MRNGYLQYTQSYHGGLMLQPLVCPIPLSRELKEAQPYLLTSVALLQNAVPSMELCLTAL